MQAHQGSGGMPSTAMQLSGWVEPPAVLAVVATIYLGAAIFIALSLLDPYPNKSAPRRWARQLFASLALLLGALAFLWLDVLPAGTTALWDRLTPSAMIGILVGAGLTVFGIDQRQRSSAFYAACALPWAIGLAWASQLSLLGNSAEAPRLLHGNDQAAAWILLACGQSLGLAVACFLRRRRDGSPGLVLLAGATLMALSTQVYRPLLLNSAFELGQRGERWSPGGSEWIQVLAIGLIVMLGLVAVAARRRANRDAAGERLALRKSSRVEGITGLPTLDVISESFVRVLRLSVAGHNACALAVIHFAALERVQSAQSKEARDRLFSEAAWRLRSQRREEELIGAMGGDRLIMVLRVQDANEATARLRELLAHFDQPVGDEQLRFRLRPAAGLTVWPAHGDDFARLLANALVALERCPPGGVQLFHAAQREENEHRLRVESTLSGAIAQGELGLVLQPIVDALSGEVRMVELLARWNNSELGNVSPRQFILIAESSGVIDEFDRWLLREALSTTKWMDAAGFPDIRVSLNCSPVNLADPAFMDFFERTVKTSGVNPARLEVEVTEAALAEGDHSIVESLLRLRALGVGLTIDDFGIGHSSLARLRDLPIDSLKIDQSFVQDMGYPQGEFLVSGILGLAHGLGKVVIAEGVETEAQRAALVDLGCEYLQGFGISRPLSWRGLLDFLGSESGEDAPEAPDALRSGASQA